jgi:hypothetical protein
MRSVVLVLLFALAAKAGKSDFERLNAALFSDYDREAIPIEKFNTTVVDVSFGITPLYLEMDEFGILKGRVWIRMLWTDYRLQWDPKLFGGVDVARVDAAMAWMPDMILYNRRDSSKPMFPFKTPGVGSNVLVYPTGSVLYVPDVHIEAVCNEADLDNFWSEQNCTLKFGSWTVDGATMNLKIYDNATEMDVSEYSKTSPLKIVSALAKLETKYYDCCPEPYQDVQYNMVVQRMFKVTDDGEIIRNPNIFTEHALP